MLVGAALAGFFGFLIGIPVLRLNGDYLAIVTLAFGEIIKSILTNVYLGVDKDGFQFSFLSDKNNLGEGAIQLIKGPMGVMNSARISTFVAGFVLVIISLVIIFNLVNSRTGRAVMAARDNRIAAESVGISATKYKLMAFVTSAALAGAAGTLYGCSQVTFTATKFDFNTSILILVFVVLGGLGNMWGFGDRRRRPDHPARGAASVCRLPYAGVRHRADPGDAGHQQSPAAGLYPAPAQPF